MEAAYRTITIRNRERTFESASTQETNFLHAVRHNAAAKVFREQVWDQKDSIEAVVRHHLRLRKDVLCRLLPDEFWFQGGFNTCGIIEVEDEGHISPYIFRCPMPHKLAERRYPGTVDDKVLCEAGTYVWFQENCTDIRIPKLHAFGISGNRHFTHADSGPFYMRAYQAFKRWMYRLLNRPLLSKYYQNRYVPSVDTAYMLLEYIPPEIGNPLMYTWTQHMSDPDKTSRLYQGISRIMLSLARLPQPNIGSFRFDPSNGTVSLSARPLNCTMMLFENGETPRIMQPDQIYRNTDSYVSDMLTLYDTNLLHNPHAVRNADDAKERMALRVMLRSVAHHYIFPELREGPFILQLTDVHQSNIMVDDDWNVTCLIDLEWVNALPAESETVPYWLTGCGIDTIKGEDYSTFDVTRKRFLEIMDEEAKKFEWGHDINVTEVLRRSWDSNAVWFWKCLRSIDGWLLIFEGNMLSKYTENEKLAIDLKELSVLWHEKVDEIVQRKASEEEKYQAEILELFLEKDTDKKEEDKE